jgi:hypothetical protein
MDRANDILVFNKAIGDLKNDVSNKGADRSEGKYNIYSYYISNHYSGANLGRDMQSPDLNVQNSTPKKRSASHHGYSLSSSFASPSPLPESVSLFSSKSAIMTRIPSPCKVKKRVETEEKVVAHMQSSDNHLPEQNLSLKPVSSTNVGFDGMMAVNSFFDDPTTPVVVPGVIVDTLPSCFESVWNSYTALNSLTTLHKLLSDFPVATIVFATAAANGDAENSMFVI